MSNGLLPSPEVKGYVAAMLVLLTFAIRSPWGLRLAAIASNLALVAYGSRARGSGVLPPVSLPCRGMLEVDAIVPVGEGGWVAPLQRGDSPVTLCIVVRSTRHRSAERATAAR